MGRIITTLPPASHQALNIPFLLVTTSDQRKVGKIPSIFCVYLLRQNGVLTNKKSAEALFLLMRPDMPAGIKELYDKRCR